MLADARDNLYAAIERLYLTFADYPLVWWNGPYCCTSKKDEKRLHSKPLRELTGAEMYLYEWHVFLCGRQDIEGYKHLLPRSLELLANGESYAGEEVLMSRLVMAGWLDWPAEEREAVLDYLVSVWRVILSDVNHVVTPEGWLISLAIAGVDLDSFLEMWRQDSSAGAAWRFAQMIICNWRDLADGVLGGTYWSGHQQEMREVIDWIFSRATAAMLQPALFESFGRNVSDCVSSANDCFRNVNVIRLMRLLLWRIDETNRSDAGKQVSND